MNYYLYLFEAHSIQRYILNSGKLKDMVGASELLENLLLKPLDDTLHQLGLVEKADGVGDYEFSRRGGGAFSLVFTDEAKAQALRDLWGLVVQGIAPGLSFNHIVSAVADSPKAAFSAAQEQLGILRNYHEAILPVAGPLVRRSPRTGQPAVQLDQRGEDQEWIDGATRQKRAYSDRESDLLSAKFLRVKTSTGTETLTNLAFPRDTDTEFPVDATRYVAILHADGNGLGNIVRKLAAGSGNKNYAHTFLSFSEGVNRATCDAAQEALMPLIEKFAQTEAAAKGYLPFRPLVLGGDDLTVIVRADYAFEYAKDFLNLFEKKTAEFLKGDQALQQIEGMPTGMTACAGMAFIKINQPFAMGYRLAESLCDYAKAASRQATGNDEQALMPSSLVFHRVTSTTIEDYNKALPRELTATDVAADSVTHYRKTLGAYGVGQGAAVLPPLDSLRKMKALFTHPAMSRGPMRHFMTLLDESIPEAKKAYRRWQENMGKDDELSAYYREYLNLLEALQIDRAGDLPFAPVVMYGASGSDGAGKEAGKGDELQQSFLADLSNWIAVEGERHEG